MKNKANKNKKKSHGNTWKPTQTMFRFVILAVTFFLVSLGSYFILRPRPVWIVEASFEAAWRRLLASSNLPRSWQVIQRLDEPQAKVNSKVYGFRISRFITEGRSNSGIEALYPYLSQMGEYQGALVLAANPWLVYRSNRGLPLTRTRAEGTGEGTLYMAGRDPRALAGWTAQLLQEQPGLFPPWGDQWIVLSDNLIRRRHFQQGAPTYSWVEIWPLVINDPSAWVYAPLDAVQQLPGYRSSLLEADRFPEKEDWNEFSLQAQVLWAVPFGVENSRYRTRVLRKATTWLRDAHTQSSLAAAIGWIPAHRNGTPTNPIAHSAQLAWLTSSYIWEASFPEKAGD